MKRIILFTLLMFLPIFSFGQVKSLDEIDKFTRFHELYVRAAKKTKWSTFDNISKGIHSHIYLSLRQSKNEDSDYRFLYIDVTNVNSLCMNSTSKIIFLLDNDKTVEFNNIKNSDCGNRLTFMYSITEEQIRILSENKISEFRIYYSDSYIEYIVKDDKKDIVKNTFKLFNEEIQSN